jgi:Peptidase U49
MHTRRSCLRMMTALAAARWLPAAAALASQAETPQSSPASAEPALLTPVLGELQACLSELLELTPADSPITPLLARIRVEIDGRYRRLSPNAMAAGGPLGPRIVVDLALLYRIWRLADLGFLPQLDQASSAVNRSAVAYGQAVAAAKQQGRPAPDFSFDIEHSGLSPLLQAMAHDLAREVSTALTAWVILHEVGHHVLEHVAAPAATPAVQQERELAADKYATEMFLRLGYGAASLRCGVDLLAMEEIVQELAGFTVFDDQSTHPRWQVRNDHVKQLTIAREVPQFPYYAIRTWVVNANGEPLPETYAFPSDRGVEQAIGLVQTERPGVCGVERNGETVTLYVRPLQGLQQEITFPDLQTFWVRGTARTLPDGPTVPVQGYQISIATSRSLVPGLPGLDPAYSSRAQIAKLNEQLLPGSLADQITSLQMESQALQLRYYVDYMKGSTTLPGYRALALKAAASYDDQLGDILGKEPAAKYRTQVQQWVAAHTMSPAVLGRLQAWQQPQ